MQQNVSSNEGTRRRGLHEQQGGSGKKKDRSAASEENIDILFGNGHDCRPPGQIRSLRKEENMPNAAVRKKGEKQNEMHNSGCTSLTNLVRPEGILVIA